MRIGDWSSDVCSSDLCVLSASICVCFFPNQFPRSPQQAPSNNTINADHSREERLPTFVGICLGSSASKPCIRKPKQKREEHKKIGRASGRERVGQYV